MITDGLILTVAGMLVAFGFLGMMALTTEVMSRAIHRWFPGEPPPAGPGAGADEVAVAIAVAAAHLHLNGTRHAHG